MKPSEMPDQNGDVAETAKRCVVCKGVSELHPTSELLRILAIF